MKLDLGFFTLILFSATVSFAADKDQYTLFNPTPPAALREMSTDRPDRTESAYTVDAGHFQHETDLISYFYNNNGGTEDQSYLFAAPNLKIGLTNSADLQLIFNSFVYEKSKDNETKKHSTESGNGDTIVRLKYNIYGNDSGESALAVMPFLKFPTASNGLGNNHYEGGVILPFALSLSEGHDLGLQTEVDLARDSDDKNGYHPEFVNTATISSEIRDGLSNYVELWTNLSTEETPIQITFDIGFVYEVGNDSYVDIGANIGLTEVTEDLNLFLGLSQRF